MPLTTSAKKLRAWIQWVTRTRAECRGESRTSEFWIASPWEVCGLCHAIAGIIAREKLEVNTDRGYDKPLLNPFATRKAGRKVATATDATFLYVWNVNG